jgi:hypothetical protein
MHPRTVTSFYSNLVARPTGRAVRMGVESQIAELPAARAGCLSILDFSQVRVVDYSCADEIVAKLLLRYSTADRPGDVYFLVRGIQEHHQEAIEAVLQHHDLLVCAEDDAGRLLLLGQSSVPQRVCWSALARLNRAAVADISAASGLAERYAADALAMLAARRVVVPLVDSTYCLVTALAAQQPDG